MLNAVIVIPDHLGSRAPVALARSLATLFPAVMSGLLHEAQIVADRPDPQLLHLCDQAGCGLLDTQVPLDLRQICGSAKASWLLLLEAGSVLREGWEERLPEQLSMLAENDAAACFSQDTTSLASGRRFKAWYSNRVAGIVGRAGPEHGLLLRCQAGFAMPDMYIGPGAWPSRSAPVRVRLIGERIATAAHTG
ncbi:MAG: hypothetical protein WBO55_11240 [Rhizobiaceae bacterium]